MPRKPRHDPTPTPPPAVSVAVASWWRGVQHEYAIADHAGVMLLNQAALALHRAEQARAAIERDGLTVTDRFGCVKHHPLLPHLRDAESSFRSSLAALRLDAEPARPPGRPGGV